MNAKAFRSALLSILLILTLHAVPQASYAAVLQVDANGFLTGATGVDVGGSIYDVTFNAGTCIPVYTGCNVTVDHIFPTATDAVTASQALLDQVFVDGSAGNFDSSPWMTRGCGPSSVTYCEAAAPYALSGLGNLAVAVAHNHQSNNGDLAVATLASPLSYSGSSNYVTWAVWTPSAPVPVPASVLLLLSGCAGIFGFGRVRTA